MPIEALETDSPKTASYVLRESQVEWIKAEALRRGVSASDVARELIECAIPVYEDDMRSIDRRRAARKAAF